MSSKAYTPWCKMTDGRTIECEIRNAPQSLAGIGLDPHIAMFGVGKSLHRDLAVDAVNSYAAHYSDPIQAAQEDMLGKALEVLEEISKMSPIDYETLEMAADKAKAFLINAGSK